MLSILKKLTPLTSKHHLLHQSSTPNIISFLHHFSSLPLSLCPGCGIQTQASNPSLPGFFILPSSKSPPISLLFSPQTSLSLKSGFSQDISEHNPDPPPENPKPLICARCHSLRHYGHVKDLSAEKLLPKSDFDAIIFAKIASLSGPRSVVLLIVDAVDFDGTFPRKPASLLSTFLEDNAFAWKENRPSNVPRIMLVVTKIDLLPSHVTCKMVEKWARRRIHAFGVLRIEGIHVVSAKNDLGVRKLVEEVGGFVGGRGNVWAIGAQNVGKSTLINAMGRCVGRKMLQLTEAALPGTTLGVVRVEGVLCGDARLFDTPGLVHEYQIMMRLNREEQKLVHVSKRLVPRTYRIKVVLHG